MMPSLATLFGKAWASLAEPRVVARWVMSFDMPRLARWEVLFLVVVLSAIFARVTVLLVARPQAIVFSEILSNPWVTGLIQLSVLVIAVFTIFWVGRAMGGRGRFGSAILLVAWLQFCMVCLQLVQLGFMFLFPPVASLIGFAGLAVFFWLLTNFVAELHGFQSLPQVFLMIIVSLVGMVFGISLILSIIGVTIPGTAMNV